jgi:hypothetical protein
MSIVTLILQAFDKYKDGDFSVTGGYLYLTIIYNVSVSLALYGLFLFYAATKHSLAKYEPVLKFLTVKSVIFLTFWQGKFRFIHSGEINKDFILGVLLAIFERFGIIQAFQGKTNLSVGTVAAGQCDREFLFIKILICFLFIKGWQSFFICIEMCVASIALRFAFPHEPYIIRETYLPSSTLNNGQSEAGGPGGRIVSMQSISSNLKETMNPKDIMHGNLKFFVS